MPATAALPVTCRHCEHEFRVKPEAAGRSVKCPQCRERTPVDPPDDIEIEDPDTIPELEIPLLPDDSPPTVSQSAYTTIPPIKEPAGREPIRIRDQNIEPRNYPALAMLRTIYYVLAVLVGAQWIVVTLFVLGSGLVGGAAAGDAGVGGGLLMMAVIPLSIHTAGSAVAACTLVATAEMIRLALDVQDDTRRTAVYASRLPVN